MTAFHLVALVVVGSLTIYLTIALLWPERFE